MSSHLKCWNYSIRLEIISVGKTFLRLILLCSVNAILLTRVVMTSEALEWSRKS